MLRRGFLLGRLLRRRERLEYELAVSICYSMGAPIDQRAAHTEDGEQVLRDHAEHKVFTISFCKFRPC